MKRGRALLGILFMPGCTTFATVRPAEIHPGLSFHTQATVSAPPGELPGWIWSFDCAEDCNKGIPGVELSLFHGVSDSTRGYYLGGGLVAPINPFLEGYWRFSRNAPARGIGARIGIPVSGWSEARVFYRQDIGSRVTSNTNFVVTTGSSPNGANTATFLALIESVGLVERSAGSVIIPALSVGVTHTVRTRYGDRETAFGLLGVASFGVEILRGSRQ
jgi:hypothetical protein